MRIDNPSISGSLSFIGGTNSISATSVSLTGSLSGTFEGQFSGDSLSNISGAFNEASAALAQNIETRLLNTTDTLDGDLTVTGKITAQEFHTEFVSASIIYQSGSTQFGDSADDVHTFTGNIGIGIDSPDYKLRIDASDDTQLKLNRTGVGAVTLGVNADGGLSIADDGTDRLVVDENGNVGIGTDSPATGLNLKEANTGTEGLIITNWNNTQTVKLGSDNTTGGGKFTLATNGGTTNVFLSAYSDSYLTGGNVGIGYTTPNARLQVSGVAPTYTNNATVFWGSTTNNHSHTGISLTSGGNALQGFVGSNLYWGENSNTPTQSNADRSSGYIQFVNTTVAGQKSTIHLGGTVKGSTTVSPIMTVNGTGKVGINNTGPAGKLHVSLNNDSTVNIFDWSENEVVFARGNTSRSQGIGFGVHTSNSTATISSLTPAVAWNALDFRASSFRLLSSGGTDGFSQDSSGNVGFAQNVTVDGVLYLGGTHTRISDNGSGEVGINYAASNTSTYSLTVYDSTSRVFGVEKGGDIYIAPGATYSQTYSYADSWASSFQDVVPTGTLNGNRVYLFTIWTSTFGQPPYYAAASTIITTATNTNSGGNGPEVDLITAHHVGSTSKWQLRMSTAGNSTNGVQVKLLNGPTGTAPSVYVRVTEISYYQ